MLRLCLTTPTTTSQCSLTNSASLSVISEQLARNCFSHIARTSSVRTFYFGRQKFQWVLFFLYIDEQFLLQRLANAAIDIYGMAAVISRSVGKKEKYALAGSRTRIYCLEGNNADRYTTNARLSGGPTNLALYNNTPTHTTHTELPSR